MRAWFSFSKGTNALTAGDGGGQRERMSESEKASYSEPKRCKSLYSQALL